MAAPRWGKVWSIESCYIFERAMLRGYQLTLMGCGQHWQSKKHVNCNNFLKSLENFWLRHTLEMKKIQKIYMNTYNTYVFSQLFCFMACFGNAFNGFRTDKRGNRRICLKNVVLLIVLCGPSMTQHCADHQNISEHATMYRKSCFGVLRCGGSCDLHRAPNSHVPIWECGA